MIWVIIILVYFAIAWFTYKKFTSTWNKSKWEQIALSFSWICILPLYGIRKIQEIFFLKK